MKKLLCLALAVLMLFALAACAQNNNETKTPATNAPDTQPPETKAPETKAPETQAPETKAPETEPAPAQGYTPAEIEAAIAAALGDGYLATVQIPEDEIYTCPLGWLEDASVVESWVAKQAAISALNPDNVVVAKCKTAADAETVVQAFNNCFAQQIGYSRQYPFSVAKVEGCRICRVEDTVMYILTGAEADPEADEEAAARLAAAEYEKVDAALQTLFGFVPENLAEIPDDQGSGGLLGG